MSLRILMLNYEFPPIGGGAGHAHMCLLNEYAHRNDLTVDVLTSMPDLGFSIDQFSENITIHKIGLHKKNLHYWRMIEVLEWLSKAEYHYRRLLEYHNFDLIHAFFGFPSGWLCWRSAAKIPYIISLRGSDVPGYNVRLSLNYRLLSGLFKRIWSRASSVVANSRGLQRLANNFMPELDVGVIPNGVDTSRFHCIRTRRAGKRLKILVVCRLISRKRIDLLIKVIAMLSSMGKDVELNIAGDGNLRVELQNLAHDIGIAHRVNFLGRIPADQMPEVYRNNDIFVMSSMHEGMSNAMLEAMASGLPIITTRCEGVEELVADNGVIVPRAEVGEISQAISKVCDNEQNYSSMSSASRKLATLYTWESVASNYIEYYQNIIESQKQSERNSDVAYSPQKLEFISSSQLRKRGFESVVTKS